MRRPPDPNLPSAAMPWGRWVSAPHEETEERIRRDRENPDSPGRTFAATADLVALQIAGIQVATMREIQLPDFSQSVSGALGTAVVALSSQFTASPPNAKSASCLVILNFRITSSTGNAPNLPLMKVNGTLFSDVGANALRPPADASEGYFSVMGQVSLVRGQAIDFQYGASASVNPTPNELTFDLATAWLAFYGGT